MSPPPDTILVVEDDAATRTFLADNLTADGYELLVADSARAAISLLDARAPDLAVLDLGLPDRDGLDVIAHVRHADGNTNGADPDLPILVLSGRAGELDRMRGWERGCDDYVTKPFAYPELRARVDAMLRRTRGRRRSGRIVVGGLEIDPVGREVRVGGERVTLAAKEYALLSALAAEPARVFTKQELLRDVWGFRSLGHTRTLDSHACRLRQKLATKGGRFVANVWGVGYRLVDGAPQ
ncbi:MAG TPA: response regulator transcription factor [Solirubrobacteraceae bacterium]